jgi:hypothetical protein
MQTKDFTLHRTRQEGEPAADTCIATLPSLPIRLQLYRAMRAAQGFTDEDVENAAPVPSGKPNHQDATAIAWATLAMCWMSGRPADLPDSLRAFDRDVVKCGEAAVTAMWDAGYRDQLESSNVGTVLFGWMLEQTFGARGTTAKVKEAAEGFPEAPAQ